MAHGIVEVEVHESVSMTQRLKSLIRIAAQVLLSEALRERASITDSCYALSTDFPQRREGVKFLFLASLRLRVRLLRNISS